MSRARATFAEIKDEFNCITVDGREHFHSQVDEAKPGTLRLVAGWDTYLMGYRDRTHFLSADSKEKIMAGGWIYPSVVLDGRIIGSWRATRDRDQRDRDQIAVRVAFLTEPTRAMISRARAEARDVGRFFGRPATFEVVPGF
jgi:hypothetical protein